MLLYGAVWDCPGSTEDDDEEFVTPIGSKLAVWDVVLVIVLDKVEFVIPVGSRLAV